MECLPHGNLIFGVLQYVQVIDWPLCTWPMMSYKTAKRRVPSSLEILPLFYLMLINMPQSKCLVMKNRLKWVWKFKALKVWCFVNRIILILIFHENGIIYRVRFHFDILIFNKNKKPYGVISIVVQYDLCNRLSCKFKSLLYFLKSLDMWLFFICFFFFPEMQKKK